MARLLADQIGRTQGQRILVVSCNAVVAGNFKGTKIFGSFVIFDPTSATALCWSGCFGKYSFGILTGLDPCPTLAESSSIKSTREPDRFRFSKSPSGAYPDTISQNDARAALARVCHAIRSAVRWGRARRSASHVRAPLDSLNWEQIGLSTIQAFSNG